MDFIFEDKQGYSQKYRLPLTNYQATASEVVSFNLLLWELLQVNSQSTQNLSLDALFPIPFWHENVIPQQHLFTISLSEVPLVTGVSGLEDELLIDDLIELKPKAVFSGQIQIHGVERGKPSSLLFEGSDSDMIEE